MGKSICFFNNKGGVGKTTLACNIASYLANKFNKKILIIDADPQCNSSQYILPIELYTHILEGGMYNTLLDVISPIEEGNSEINFNVEIVPSFENRFAVDIIPGHPSVSLFEDKLSSSWVNLNHDVGSLRITNWSNNLNEKLKEKYDYIIYDVGPSLGALNRTILLGCDYFITPMGCDTFSIMGIKNISEWLKSWSALYQTNYRNLYNIKETLVRKHENEVLSSLESKCIYIGYTVQQYITTRKVKGVKRPTIAYENIITQIPQCISDNLRDFMSNQLTLDKANLGDVPHLYSLVPLAQRSNSPIFSLGNKDGLVGSQYSQLEDYREMIDRITEGILSNINGGKWSE